MGKLFDAMQLFVNKNIGKQTVLISYATNIGNVRPKNEDNLFIDGLGTRAKENMSGNRLLNHSERYTFAVCDGMGGEQFGDEASAIASLAIAQYATQLNRVKPEVLPDTVNKLVSEANNRISRMVYSKHANLSGSTLVLTCLRKNKAYIFNLGDSRAYFFKDGELRQITEDHTVAKRKEKSQPLSDDDRKKLSDTHRLTTFLGVDSRWIGLKAQAYEPLNIRKGILLLCSDGLTDMCSKSEISEILSGEFKNCADRLVKRALKNGGTDNITCLAIKI